MVHSVPLAMRFGYLVSHADAKSDRLKLGVRSQQNFHMLHHLHSAPFTDWTRESCVPSVPMLTSPSTSALQAIMFMACMHLFTIMFMHACTSSPPHDPETTVEN